MSRALVVSGGGSKGAYAVGVAKVLMNEGDLTFDVVSGTSTGGLICPFVAAKRICFLGFSYREHNMKILPLPPHGGSCTYFGCTYQMREGEADAAWRLLKVPRNRVNPTFNDHDLDCRNFLRVSGVLTSR